jgi:Skp family chaperone for outer membrane proteins
MGYDRPDRERLVYQGVIGASERVQSKIEKERKRVDDILKKMENAKKASVKELKDAQKEAERQLDRFTKMRDKAQKELEDRITD